MDPELKLKIQRRVVRNFFHSEKTTNLAYPWKGNKFFGMELVEIFYVFDANFKKIVKVSGD